MNELRGFGPENQALGRRYGIADAAVGTMASDLFPIIDASFAYIDPEFLALEGARMRAGMRSTAAAVAARFSAVGLANPVGSGAIAILEKVNFITAVAVQFMRQAAAVSALQATDQGVALDSRITERASLRLLATDEAALANYGTVFRVLIGPAATDFREDSFPYVLAPGSTLWLVSTVVNTAVSASFIWRQRRIEDGEVSPV